MAGRWDLSYSNGHKDSYQILSDGSVSLQSSKRTRKLEVSKNQKVFPSSQGWFMLSKLFRDAAWEYVRLKNDGTLEIHHFCTDGCRATLQGQGNYCCKGTGVEKGKQK